MSFKILIDKLIQSLYPSKCLYCNKMLNINSDNKWFCNSCIDKFEIIDGKFDKCEKCGRIIEHKGNCAMCNNNAFYDNGYVLFEYAGNIRDCIIRYKFNNKKSYSEYFADVMAEYIKLKTDGKYESIYDYITCVPLYKSKERIRGYNQTELIAKKLSKSLNIPYVRAVKKIRNTKQQSTLSEKEREINIKNAFKCCYNIKDRKILIVDDILTTGHTINECSRILKKAGADRVDFAAIACVNKLNR